MKKLISILSLVLFVAVMAPACSSSDETFEEVVMNSELDQTAPATGGDDGSSGGAGGGD